MGKIFDLDSPFMSGLNKIADLMILNLITIVCCIPVITIGASLTALHFVALKMVRNEETYILKTFFRSFKQNFIQATIIWIIQLLVMVLIIFDFLIINHSGMNFPFWVAMGLIAVTGLIVALGFHTFPLLSKFDNTVFRTIKNSVLVGLLIFPKTILEMIIWAIPVAVMYYFGQALPLLILFGFSVPAYVCAMLYNKTFMKFEPEVESKSPDDWSVDEILASETQDSVSEEVIEAVQIKDEADTDN